MFIKNHLNIIITNTQHYYKKHFDKYDIMIFFVKDAMRVWCHPRCQGLLAFTRNFRQILAMVDTFKNCSNIVTSSCKEASQTQLVQLRQGSANVFFFG